MMQTAPPPPQRARARVVKALERDIDRPDSALDEQYAGFNDLEQTCKKCGHKFAVQKNNAQSCVGHPGELEVDWMSCARNVSVGLLVGAGIGSVVGALGWVVAKAVVAPVIMAPPPLPGLTTLALSAQTAGAASGSTAAAAAGASIGSLATAAAALPAAPAAGTVVSPGVFVGAGVSAAGAVGGAVKAVQSANDEVGAKSGSHRWTCCGYHQSEASCDGRLSMHLPRPEEPECEGEMVQSRWQCPGLLAKS
eukprot:TRINITY_DN5852_c0_g1_i2.p3 TRINITY_DN5852_c0_g1~~TRINITY_DN5852_c0_g1_i2.p3  ORF type:complete len:279 (+),score=81.48 TRINITY_DN5852_c0_g1_i2:87-839(+)